MSLADPPDLCARWLNYASGALDKHHLERSKNELEACRIGLRGYATPGSPAERMMERLTEAKKQ